MKPVPAKAASDLLMKYHYLGRLPRATVVVCAVFDGDNPEPVAAVFFGHPATKWSVPVLELTRHGSSSANVVKRANPDLEIEKHVAEGKYLYWRALDGRAEKDAKTVGLEKNPYPKPGQ